MPRDPQHGVGLRRRMCPKLLGRDTMQRAAHEVRSGFELRSDREYASFHGDLGRCLERLSGLAGEAGGRAVRQLTETSNAPVWMSRRARSSGKLLPGRLSVSIADALRPWESPQSR